MNLICLCSSQNQPVICSDTFFWNPSPHKTSYITALNYTCGSVHPISWVIFFFFFGLSVFSSLCLVKPFDLLEPYCLLSIWQVSLCLSMRPSSTSDNFMNFISYLSNCVFKARKERGRDALPTARLNHYLNVMHAMPLPSRRADTGEYNHMWSVKLIKFNLSPIL